MQSPIHSPVVTPDNEKGLLGNDVSANRDDVALTSKTKSSTLTPAMVPELKPPGALTE